MYQSVSALVRSGSWQSSTLGGHTAVAHGSGGRSTISGVSVHQSSGASELARLLSAPARPVKATSNFVWFACPFALSLIVGGLILPVNTAMLPKLLAVIGFAGVLGCAVGGFVDSAQREPSYLNTVRLWERRVRAWEGFMYCSRCNIVVDPAFSNYRPLTSWPALLNNY